MIVTAALIWWNELPADLERCVRGLATIADRLVAVDGAYARYPGAKVASPIAQVHAIAETARQVGIEVVDVDRPKRLWAGQVEKRAFALSEAAKGSDWVAVVDADWVVMGDRISARKELNSYRSDIDVVAVPFYTPPSDNEVASGWHTAVSGTTVFLPHLFRALPQITVEKYHWWYTAQKGQRKVYLWGPPNQGMLRPAHNLEAPYQIHHMTLHRTPEQVRASRAFVNDRIKVVALTDQEDDRDDLPRPEFDFETVATLAAQRSAGRRMTPRERHILRRQGR
jgi:hypothetical protein